MNNKGPIGEEIWVNDKTDYELRRVLIASDQPIDILTYKALLPPGADIIHFRRNYRRDRRITEWRAWLIWNPDPELPDPFEDAEPRPDFDWWTYESQFISLPPTEGEDVAGDSLRKLPPTRTAEFIGDDGTIAVGSEIEKPTPVPALEKIEIPKRRRPDRKFIEFIYS